VLYNIPTACNRASADFVISSPLILEEYERIVPAHQARRPRATPRALSTQAAGAG
jgi:methylglyoxal synthase